MPELAEVEYFRRQWDCGLGQKILVAELGGKRVSRGLDLSAVQNALTGARLLESRAHGKQMLFRFSGNAWLGVHLGMTGELRAKPPGAARERHDHLILHQRRQTLVFNDPRQFGRILFDIGAGEPQWWRRLPPQILSPDFSLDRVAKFLARRGRAPIKAVLLMQQAFPGIGNWMADEVLWQARIHPRRLAGSLSLAETRRLHSKLKSVTRISLRAIGSDWGDPPKNWLIHRRWRRGGFCPRDGAPLRHATIGGRTTCWCPKCQAQNHG